MLRFSVATLQSSELGIKCAVRSTDNFLAAELLHAAQSVTYQGISNAIHNFFSQFRCCFLHGFTRRASNSKSLKNDDHQLILVHSRTNILTPHLTNILFLLNVNTLQKNRIMRTWNNQIIRMTLKPVREIKRHQDRERTRANITSSCRILVTYDEPSK